MQLTAAKKASTVKAKLLYISMVLHRVIKCVILSVQSIYRVPQVTESDIFYLVRSSFYPV